jgi:hypothetical protein
MKILGRKVMEEKIIVIYCICDDLLNSLNIKDNPQAKMTNAEVMTTALSATLLFSGNYERSRSFLKSFDFIPNMLSKSRFNRRLNSISDSVWQYVFNIIATIFKNNNTSKEYIVDSFPIPVCDNIRIKRCKIYSSEEFRGYISSKRRYFYGIRVHMIVTKSGEPVEFILSPGAPNDVKVLKDFEFDLPEGSIVYGDKGYNDYEFEDLLKEIANINLRPIRKKNSKRAYDPWVPFLHNKTRKYIETTFSKITNLFPKSIHAVTPKGFELKIALFLIAFTIDCL